MISVGIDVSKGESTVCVLKPYGEVLNPPFKIVHTESSLVTLVGMLTELSNEDEVRVILEATGIYHLPVLSFLKQHGIFVAVVNPLSMKKYASIALRKGKTDKIDSMKIAHFGLDYWFHLINHQPDDEVYTELRELSRQYLSYMGMKVKAKVNLTNLLEKTMPGIKTLFRSQTDGFTQDKLCAVARRYWHFDNITGVSEKKFTDGFAVWAKKQGFHSNEKKAHALYLLASEGIPTLSSRVASTKMLVQEAVRIVLEVESTLNIILEQMRKLAETLKEYQVVLAMPGIGTTLAPRLIAEIGNVRRFHNGSSLVAYAGLDSPPYQSGTFTATKRSISKRGSPTLRKTGFEVISSIRKAKPTFDNAVFLFMQKKEAEGKPTKVAKIAGLNKLLRIYYARVKETYLT
jgi:transposase